MDSMQRGISLTELVTGLAVVGVVSSITLPALQDLVADYRRAATVNELVAVFNFARHRSIVGRRPVVVCGSADGVHCDGRWTSGWIGFVKPPRWRPRDAVDDASIIARRAPVHPTLAIAANRDRFHFRTHSRRSTNGTMVVCSVRGGGRALVVSYTGRVRTTQTLPDWAQPCR